MRSTPILDDGGPTLGNEIAEGDMAANGLGDKAFAVRLNLTPTKTNQCQVNVTWKHLIY